MARGETDTLDGVDALRTETVGLTEPVFWSFRRDDHDRKFPQRTWVIEVSLALHGGRLLLGYRLHLVNRGDPAPFQRSVPKFMRDIACRYNIYLDDVETDLTATPVETADEVDGLIRLLNDPARTVPVIAVSTLSHDAAAGRFSIDADALAGAVFGAAHVRVLSRDAAFMLTDRIGKPLSVYQGAVRIWRAGRPVADGLPYDHPLFLAGRIAEDGAGYVTRSITDEVLRASAGRRDAERLVPSFAQVRRTASEWGREAARRAHGSADELLPLYEADNKRLMEELSEYEDMLAIAEHNLTEARKEREEAEREIASLRAQLDHLHGALRAPAHLPDIAIPSDFEELSDWSRSCLGEEVVVLKRAVRGARKSSHANPALSYRALLLLKEAYVPMKRGVETARQRWEAGLRQLGLELARTFSGAGAGEFGDEYFVDWEGRRRDLEWHLKGSNSRDPRRCFRMYFFWCDTTSRVVVGAFPNHLTNNLT